MRKLLFAFGTRPEAIKMAPLIREFRKYPDVFEMLVCVTGQHRQMLDPVLALFEIVPDIDLDIIRPDQDLSDITSSVLKGMQGVLQKVIPDLVLVQGDTTTSMAAALAAFYRRIPVAHVEAGLRTHHMLSPWPEEMNRSIIGRIATWHFAPTARAKQNLMDENVPEDRICVTGNTVIDALQWVIARLKSSGEMIRQMDALLLRKGFDIRRLDIHRRLILVTGHRRESFGEGFNNICHAISDLSLAHPDVDFVYPVHLNPHVRKPVHEILGDRTANGNVFLLEPLDYLPFIYLMSNACLVLTDSGGIQEEAPALGKPVLVMRDTTERPEALEARTARLVGTDRENIGKVVSTLLTDKNSYRAMSKAINPYGDGHASERIVAFIRTLT
ncbi:MAG TPA: UDP-N-acetylglucosamine 2-epimerase (non-hydrolyzing) [Bacteroidales bacterium]|nr:UDP-N-acetylglucosamine 2-epimerase (non-hydrolyzing) [Bacteroidales bacterium]